MSKLSRSLLIAVVLALFFFSQSLIAFHGVVLMTHDDSGVWTVTKPDGTILSTLGTTSQGFAEGWNYALQHFYNFRVEGGGGALAVIYISAPAHILPTENTTADINGVTITSLWTDSRPTIVLDSCMSARISMPGTQIVPSGTGAGLVLAPHTPLPFDPSTVFGACELYVTSVANGNTGPLVIFDVTNGSIVTNVIKFIELNAAGGGMYYQVINPSGSGHVFAANDFTVLNSH